MAAIELIRKYKWPLIALQVGSVLALVASLLATQGQPLTGASFAFVYGSGFLASLVWFPLCYLAWFGGPNVRVLAAIHRAAFWLALSLWLLFWVRVVSHVVGRLSVGA